MEKSSSVLAVALLAMYCVVAPWDAASAEKTADECKATEARCTHNCPQFVNGLKDERWKRCAAKCHSSLSDCMKQANKDREPPETPLDSSGATPSASAPASTRPAKPVSGLGFDGKWETETSQGSEFYLRLSVEGREVSGTFDHPADPTYNGSLKGEVDSSGRKFNYTYVQLKSGGSGSGTFTLSDDGNHLSGDFVTDQDKATHYQWTGVRQTGGRGQ